MTTSRNILCTAVLLAVTGQVSAQQSDASREDLQMAAMQALITAPEERALPLAAKVLNGNYSEELKGRALFVLSQIETPEAREILLDTARAGSGELRYEAIRMVGIGGDETALAELRPLYAGGDAEVREAVLQAYLIADDADSVYELAAATQDEAEFESAVHTLGAMGANEHLARLRDRAGNAESWLHALAISGDTETLIEVARDGSDPERQARAIRALGIADGPEVNATLVEIYRNAGSDSIREAALNGMLVADNDEGVLELYRASDDPAEKKQLLQFLVMMDSDEIWQVIDAALGEDE